MSRRARLFLVWLLVAIAAVVFGPEVLRTNDGDAERSTPIVGTVSGSAATTAQRPDRAKAHSDVGFRSRAALDEHFAKHGREFGSIAKDDYLRLAQDLRDRESGGEVLEIERTDGVISRFDKRSGAFLAFDADLTIRTFFKPNDGERYFDRQADKSHE